MKKNSKNQRWPLIISIAAILISFLAYRHEVDFSQVTIGMEKMAHELNSAMVKNSNTELDILKKQTSFEISQVLYNEFYKFGKYNTDVMRKLKHAAEERKKTGKISAQNTIQNEDNLLLYLNTFETVYDQCDRGMISFEDVRVNFKYLIGTTCNNPQVIKAIGGSYNGLKILCFYFHPTSGLSKAADTSKDMCRSQE